MTNPAAPTLASLTLDATSSELRVLAIDGHEAVSGSYVFRVRCRAEQPLDERTLLGTRARLSMEVGRQQRTIHGVVERARWHEAARERAEAGHAVTLKVVPAFDVVGRTRRSRLFQDVTAPALVERILREHGLPVRLELQGDHAVRDLCVQYRESDRELVSRLLSEEGIFTFYDHAGDRETLVLADRASSLAPACDAPLPFRAEDGLAARENEVTSLSFTLDTKPSRSALREFDFERPTHVVEAQAEVQPSHPPIEVYEHHGEHGGLDVRPEAAARRLEQLRRRARVLGGEARAPALAPGTTFGVTDTPDGARDGSYVVLRVEHELRVPERAGLEGPVYRARFACVPEGVLPRPRVQPRRVHETLLTATVVGPAGQEIHTDVHGRVRVRFHWDREHEADPTASSWIRVAQTWSGTGWGFQFIPRVGMEVLVAFVGGDLDRPLVVGAVPNLLHPVPFPLPAHKNRSGIRTQTTLGGGGYNELSFEDTAGYETVKLRAQRDLTEEVLEDHTEEVGRNKVTRVGADATSHVGHDRMTVTLGEHTEVVGGDRVENVGGSRRSTVDGDDVLHVAGQATRTFGQDREIHVRGGERHAVERGVDAKVSGHVRARVAREISVRSEEGVSLASSGHVTISSFHAATVTATRGVRLASGDGDEHAALEVAKGGKVSATASRVLELEAAEEVRIRVGDTLLRLLPDRLELLSKAVATSAERITLATDGASLALERGVDLAGQSSVKVSAAAGGALSLSADAALDGAQVRLGGAQAAEKVLRDQRAREEPTAPRVTVHLHDRHGAKLAPASYRIVVPGWEKRGDAPDGTVQVPAFEGLDRCVLEWGPPGADPLPHRAEVYLRTETGDDEETLRRKLHNLGHTGPSLEAALAHAAGSTTDPRKRTGELLADIDEALRAKRPLTRSPR